MVFTVPPSKASIDQNKFKFQLTEGGEIYSIPLFKYAPTGVVEKLSKLTPETMKFDDIFLAFDWQSDIAGVVRTLDGEQLNALTVAYKEASGISVGESSPSGDSSAPTE